MSISVRMLWGNSPETLKIPPIKDYKEHIDNAYRWLTNSQNGLSNIPNMKMPALALPSIPNYEEYEPAAYNWAKSLSLNQERRPFDGTLDGLVANYKNHCSIFIGQEGDGFLRVFWCESKKSIIYSLSKRVVEQMKINNQNLLSYLLRNGVYAFLERNANVQDVIQRIPSLDDYVSPYGTHISLFVNSTKKDDAFLRFYERGQEAETEAVMRIRTSNLDSELTEYLVRNGVYAFLESTDKYECERVFHTT